jgi:hypothetical protein
MQLLQGPHPARGPPPVSVPRRLLSELQQYNRVTDVGTGGAGRNTAAPTISLDGVSVGLAFRFVRVCVEPSHNFSIWRPVFGAESDHSNVYSPVQLEEGARTGCRDSEEDVVALPLGDVLCEGKGRVCSGGGGGLWGKSDFARQLCVQLWGRWRWRGFLVRMILQGSYVCSGGGAGADGDMWRVKQLSFGCFRYRAAVSKALSARFPPYYQVPARRRAP